MEIDLIALLVGLLIGAFGAWWMMRGRWSDTEALHARIEQLHDAKTALAEEKATLAAENKRLEAEVASQEEDLTNLEERFTHAFESLANRILDAKSEKFTQQNRKQLDQLLEPLGKKIEAFQQEVRDIKEKRIEAHASLKEQIEMLAELNQQMSEDAQSLVRALDGQAKTQGDWGEMILERILEESGLQKDREYLVQEQVTTEDGQRLRPDVVVKLPEDRCVVIDAKVSITAYNRYCKADDAEAQRAALNDHLASLRRHVRDLSGKQYQDLSVGTSPDFVLMFVPIEPAFALALQQDDQLYQDAFRQNVVLVSPTTLLATLRTVANIWRHEYQAQNAQAIAERGGKLYDKFVLFAEALTEVGRRLDQAQASYGTAMNRLKTGQGSLVRQAEMLREMGARGSKELPADVTTTQEDDA